MSQPDALIHHHLTACDRNLRNIAAALWTAHRCLTIVAPTPEALADAEVELEGLIHFYIGPIQERCQGADRPNPYFDEVTQ